MPDVKTTTIEVTRSLSITYNPQPECDFFNLHINKESIVITAADVIKNTKTVLRHLAEFIIANNQGSTILRLGGNYFMHTAPDGDHIRFTHFNKELVYWDSQELADDATCVLGAIIFAITQPEVIKKTIEK